MQVQNITCYDDGSSWSATLALRGFILCAVLVDGRLRVHQVVRKDARRAPKWMLGHIQKWAERQVKELPAEWMKKHLEMYGRAACSASITQ